ncbi:amidohydrolase [Parasedimentitalea psychrophila]|uniref:Amidohydrolase family protein n=1 Tax=Parasedimentitalea psychrophila TaxID=2997337 RepID=A0A9Y2P8X6_9RHOB|nr:amidohydrolase family protein [Parasedimentitalea psychrophila]WIY27375.1 amidohydrolase family protein [Parasedimentitalea psychrophila]
MIKVKLIIFMTAVMFLSAAISEADAQTAADQQKTTLIINADIVTMDATRPDAQALAFRDGRIVAIGTEEAVRQKIGSYDFFFDLNGRTIVPGFIESHDHAFMSSNTLLVEDVSPFTTPTLAGALTKIATVRPDKDGWIVAFGADQTLYEEKRGPTRDLLDPLFPNTPVIVYHLSGHGAFMNSEALRISGLDESTPDPAGGFYEKDDTGKLTGYLSGQPAFLPYKSYPSATHAAAVEKSKLSAEFGITTGSELAIMNAFVLEGVYQAVQDPDYATRLVGGYFSTAPDYEEIVPLLKNYETELFHIPFIKTWTDGSLQGGTAYMRNGYHDHTMGKGDSAQGSQAYFNELVLDIYRKGFWPAVHANGDAAVDVALNALENAKTEMGAANTENFRPQIIHAQVSHPEQFVRMKQLGAEPTIFTSHIYYWGDLHFERTLGPENIELMSAMKSAYDAGLRPAMHSDAPVAPVDPLLNMWAAVNRETSSGRIVGAQQAITPEQALAAYTINPAYQFGMEEDVGSLEIGKFADFVVLDGNPVKIDPREIRHIKVYATIMGGRVTYLDTPIYDRVTPLK